MKHAYVLPSASAVFGAVTREVFSSVCAFVHQPFTTKREGETMRKADVILVMLAFAFAFLTLATALPQAAFAQGIGGYALDFDGTNDYVDLPASSNMLTDAPFTIEAWIKTTVQQGAYNTEGRIVNLHRASSYSTGGAIYAGGYGTGGYSRDSICFLYCTTDGGAHSWLCYETPSPYYHDGNWHFICATHNGSTAKLYYDGVEVASEDKAYGTFGTAKAKIGSFDGAARYFEGTIDEVRIWDAALAGTTINAWKNKPVTSSHPNYSDFVAYWKLDEGSGQSAGDSEGSNDGTLGSTSGPDGNDPTWVDSDAPLPVVLSSFTAQARDGEATLRWITESEIDNLGFHVYRALEAEGEYARLTAEVLEGAGTSTSQREYAFTDTRLTNGVTYWYKIEDIAFDGARALHGPISVTPQAEVAAEVKALPTEFGLSQNVPNPFNPQTTIVYQLSEASDVRLTVCNAAGQLVQVLVDAAMEAGNYTITWDARGFGSGIYLVRLEAGAFIEARKMVKIE